MIYLSQNVMYEVQWQRCCYWCHKFGTGILGRNQRKTGLKISAWPPHLVLVEHRNYWNCWAVTLHTGKISVAAVCPTLFLTFFHGKIKTIPKSFNFNGHQCSGLTLLGFGMPGVSPFEYLHCTNLLPTANKVPNCSSFHSTELQDLVNSPRLPNVYSLELELYYRSWLPWKPVRCQVSTSTTVSPLAPVWCYLVDRQGQF